MTDVGDDDGREGGPDDHRAARPPVPERFAGRVLGGLWRQARRAMEAAGPTWPTVKITVRVGDDETRRVVGGLLGRVLRPDQATVGVILGDLDDIVRRPRDGWDLRRLLEAVGGPLPDRRAGAAARRVAVGAAFDAARRAGPDAAWFTGWLHDLERSGQVTRLVGRGEGDAPARAAAVLAALPAGGEPLPAVAARLAGDTKALSVGSLPGLVLGGLARRYGEAPPRDAAGRRALWEAAGVVPDDLASQVLVLNLPARPGPGLPGWLAEAATSGTPLRVTLHQLSRWTPVLTAPAAVHVCENPAVLRAAASEHGAKAAPLVCTEGRPSVAAARLLDAVAGGGSPLRVRADFDWAGLRIAGALLNRPGSVPWRFGAVDYQIAHRRRRPWISTRVLPGPPAPSPWDPALAIALAATGDPIYEEDLLEDLLADLA